LFFIGPNLYNNEKMSASCLTYLFTKKITEDKSLAQLAIIGLIGDMMIKNYGKTVQSILDDAQDSGMQIKRGLTVFSSMRPVHKALEFSSNIYIPGVTGSQNGAINMLRELSIEIRDQNGQGYRTLLDLDKEELSRLITYILLKRVNHGHDQEIIDNIYLVKLRSRIFDANEISTMINACGRLGFSALAIAFLTGSKEAQTEVEEVYAKYKHYLIQGLNWVNSNEKIKGDSYIIVNAKDAIKDTIIGTVTGIIASSYLYEPGTVMIGMAYRDDKIKISARVVKDHGKEAEINLYNILESIISSMGGGEVGGHPNAAGALIDKSKEAEFLELIQKKLSAQEMKIVYQAIKTEATI
jgi:RecJ-like exonuclease